MSLLLLLLPFLGFSTGNPEDTVILSSPEQVATAYLEKSFLIGGIVSPFSGQLALKKTDMVVKGAQEITLSRYYLPPLIPSSFPHHKKRQGEWDKFYLSEYLVAHYKGWGYLPYLLLEHFPHSWTFRVPQTSGVTLDFRLKAPHQSEGVLISRSYGLSNLSGEIPSGKVDIRNTRLVFDARQKKLSVHLPDGTLRIYGNGYFTPSGRSFFFLLKETLPNGKKLLYYYDNHHRLCAIEAKDPNEQLTYAKITTEDNLSFYGGSWNFHGLGGLKTEHHQTRRVITANLKKNPFTGQKMKKFQWSPILPSLLTTVNSPFFTGEKLDYNSNFLLTNYSGQRKKFQCNYSASEGHYKVSQLHLPKGDNGAFLPIYSLNYSRAVPGEKGGHTIARHIDGSSTRYDFSKNLLLTSIQWFDCQGICRKKKTFHFSDRHYLDAIKIENEKGKILFHKSFKYDPFGNPIEETLHGNLTGRGGEETYTIKREYSQDGKNLLLKEISENGKTIVWKYLDGTHLVTKKIIKDRSRTLERESYFYDSCNNLIKKVVDDGNGVCKITRYTLRQPPPFLHMVDTAWETYLENGEEKPLKTRKFIYDSFGNIKEEHVYNNNGNLAYTLKKNYSPRGDLLSETNPLGHLAEYRYDGHGDRIYQKSFSKKLCTTLTYDPARRLIHKKEGGEGTTKNFSYAYDTHDHFTQKVDPFGNVTTYRYDPITHKPIETHHPQITSLKRQPIPVKTNTTYDPLGNPLKKIDANGHLTTYAHNTYGSITEIIHPDGTQETFRYTKKGDLASHTDPEGQKVIYERDVLGRILTKRYIDISGQEVAKETFTYVGFSLQASTDKEGKKTSFSYDGAGRKIKEETLGRVTHFSYNPLGHLEKITKENEQNTLITLYIRDSLGQMLEKREEDLSGKVLRRERYTYDPHGNQTSTRSFISGQESITTFHYDPFDRLKELKDPHGSLTTLTYDHSQKGLQIFKTDPLGVIHIKAYNPFDQIIRKETLNEQKQTIAKNEYFYDPAQNLTSTLSHIYDEAALLSSKIIHYTYTPKNALETLTEEDERGPPKVTSYTYTKAGKLETKTLPSGITLFYQYDPLGYLQSLTSSNHQIHHTFQYNKVGNLLTATDETLTIQKELDPFGNILKETYPSDLTIEKTYDSFDRPLTLYIPQIGEIHYKYDPLFLRKVSRLSEEGELLYTHSYNTYDESGALIEESLINHLGQVTHSYNLKKEQTTIHSPYFSQNCIYDPLGNLISATLDEEKWTYQYDNLSQLTQENARSTHYDSLYNPLEKEGQPITIGPHHTLLQHGIHTFHYDISGNTTSHITTDTQEEFFYDPLNRLIQVTTQNSEVTYTYDPLGRRLSKKVNGNEESYLYDNTEEITTFKNNTPHTLKILGHLNRPIAIEINSIPYAPLLDIHGNLCKLIDPHQTIQAHYRYSAFGEELKGSFATIDNPYRYQTKRLDSETNLIYFGKRYYSPLLARFITPDPAGFIDSTNLYQYVFNNPFRYFDPDGQFAIAIPLLYWGAEFVVAEILIPLVYAAAVATVAYSGYKGVEMLNERTSDTETLPDIKPEDDKKKKRNTNPFDGPVGEDVCIGDTEGNVIGVPQGHKLEGSSDGKWLQIKDRDGVPTGTRKDGGGHVREKDIRGRQPHAHVPNVNNPDGTPWLPIN